MADSKLKALHIKVGIKLVEIEEIFERCGIPMPNITFIARDPNNSNRSLFMTSENSNDDARIAFELVIKATECSEQVKLTDAEAVEHVSRELLG